MCRTPSFSGYIILDLFEDTPGGVLAKIPANMMVNLAILDEHKTMGIPFKGSISGEDVTVVRQQEHLVAHPQTTPSGSRRIYAIEPDHQGAFFAAPTHSSAKRSG